MNLDTQNIFPLMSFHLAIHLNVVKISLQLCCQSCYLPYEERGKLAMQSFLFWLFRDIFSCVLCCHYLVRKSLKKCSIFMGTLLQVFVKHSVLEIKKSRVCNSVNHIFLLQMELKSTSLFCQPLWMWQEDGMYHFFNPYLNKPVISVAILCCSP